MFLHRKINEYFTLDRTSKHLIKGDYLAKVVSAFIEKKDIAAELKCTKSLTTKERAISANPL